MKKLEFCTYESPAVEWFLSPDEAGEGVLCQSPSGGLSDIEIGAEEDDWLN